MKVLQEEVAIEAMLQEAVLQVEIAVLLNHQEALQEETRKETDHQAHHDRAKEQKRRKRTKCRGKIKP